MRSGSRWMISAREVGRFPACPEWQRLWGECVESTDCVANRVVCDCRMKYIVAAPGVLFAGFPGFDEILGPRAGPRHARAAQRFVQPLRLPAGSSAYSGKGQASIEGKTGTRGEDPTLQPGLGNKPRPGRTRTGRRAEGWWGVVARRGHDLVQQPAFQALR